MSDALFAFEQVVVRFGDVDVLRGVDLSVRPGVVTVLAGPSGAGKSTLLRLCNRLEVPTSGRVLFEGDDVAGLDPLALRRRVSMVFQRPVLFGGTVRDNLAVAKVADDAAYLRVLEQVGLDGAFLDHQADDLSGGEAQRACLARSLLTDPRVLLMDEPTSSLDPAATRVLEQLAVALVAAGMSVLWVTHDLEQARRIGQDQVVVADGRVADPEAAARYLAGADPDDDHISSGPGPDGVTPGPGPDGEEGP